MTEAQLEKPKARWGKIGLFIGITAQVFLICAIVTFFSSFQFMEGMFVPILFVTLPLTVITAILLLISLILCFIGLFTKDGSRKMALTGLGVAFFLTPIFLGIVYLRLNP